MTLPFSCSRSGNIPETSKNLKTHQSVAATDTTTSVNMAGKCISTSVFKSVSTIEVEHLRMIDASAEALDDQDIRSRQAAHPKDSVLEGTSRLNIMGLPIEIREYIFCTYFNLADILDIQLPIQTLLESGIEEIVKIKYKIVKDSFNEGDLSRLFNVAICDDPVNSFLYDEMDKYNCPSWLVSLARSSDSLTLDIYDMLVSVGKSAYQMYMDIKITPNIKSFDWIKGHSVSWNDAESSLVKSGDINPNLMLFAHFEDDKFFVSNPRKKVGEEVVYERKLVNDKVREVKWSPDGSFLAVRGNEHLYFWHRGVKIDKNNFKTLQGRLASFENSDWPENMPVKTIDLARSGFYRKFDRDRVRCIVCRGGLENWVEGDTADGEHRKWYPACSSFSDDIEVKDEVQRQCEIKTPEISAPSTFDVSVK